MKKAIIFTLLFCGIIGHSQSIYNKKAVKSVMDKVNTYQLEHPWQEYDDNWIRGTYYAGVMACYLATEDKAYLEQSKRFCEGINWTLPADPPENHGGGGNLLTAAQTMVEGYLVDKENFKIENVIKHLEDPAIKNPISSPLYWHYEGNRYADGLFTGPPTLAMLYKATNDVKYLQWMDHVFWDVFGELYDQEENLFYRDKRYKPISCGPRFRGERGKDHSYSETANGKKVIWSRGNGWVMAGLARILQYVPKDHASWAKYETVFKNMAGALKKCQSEEGFWYMNLADPDDVPLKETSGTSFFIYGLTYGINNGILDKETYLPVVEKAWKSVCDAVSKEGKLQWGQRVGDRPVVIKKEDSHEYVTGTFLLAASEVYKLKK